MSDEWNVKYGVRLGGMSFGFSFNIYLKEAVAYIDFHKAWPYLFKILMSGRGRGVGGV